MVTMPPPTRLIALYRIDGDQSLNFSPLAGQMTPLVLLLLILASALCSLVHYAAGKWLAMDSQTKVKEPLNAIDESFQFQQENAWSAVLALMPGANFRPFECRSSITKRLLLITMSLQVFFMSAFYLSALPSTLLVRAKHITTKRRDAECHNYSPQVHSTGLTRASSVDIVEVVKSGRKRLLFHNEQDAAELRFREVRSCNVLYGHAWHQIEL